MGELEDAIRALQSADLNERETALDRVEALSKRGLSAADVALLIAAATQTFPPSKFRATPDGRWMARARLRSGRLGRTKSSRGFRTGESMLTGMTWTSDPS